MRALIEDIISRVKAECPEAKIVRVWNNQVLAVVEERLPLFQSPAVFIAPRPETIMQLGEGVQLYDPLDIDIHIVHWQLDSKDGNLDQNLDVFDFADLVFLALQKFKPDGAGTFVRVGQQHDYEHAGLYHFIQTYRTNYVDAQMQEPVDGIEMDVPVSLETSLELEGSVDGTAPHVADFEIVPPPAPVDQSMIF